MSKTSINVNYAGTNSFVPSAPSQRISIGDNTNPRYPRYSTLTQDCWTATFASTSVSIPLTQLYAAAVSQSNQLTWAPIILIQPNPSQTITHPSASFFNISASAELPITYQWFSQSFSQSNFSPLVNSTAYSGVTTSNLTHSSTVIGDTTSSFLCVASNAVGGTTSSIATLFVI